ncbi:hypothetical protein [Bifidobacterium bombi]|uniref:Uncharacterized protein n=1 Tax=Bifidobacterium bombi DSM 19703 TaxID=1341695 RepID=A0A080N4S2_9BIFI|nr:hypothetical protein [Bifidobacterium bombi]KFF31665.1 hypothetical protein BBOMB_1052 [Bifidobacterium bombi DSM 19703]
MTGKRKQGERGYAKLYNDGYANPKLLHAMEDYPHALNVWFMAIMWCSDKLTDGHVDHDILRYTLRATEEDITALVDLRLLDETDGGYQVHGYLGYNTSREQVETSIELRKERNARYKAKKDEEKTSKEASSEDDETVSEPSTKRLKTVLRRDEDAAKTLGRHPEDAQPRTKNQEPIYISTDVDIYKPPLAPQGGETPKKNHHSRARHPLPDDWKPNPEARQYAADHNIDLPRSADRYRLWAKSGGHKLKDWDARYLLWLKDTKPDSRTDRGQPSDKPHTHSYACEHVLSLLNRQTPDTDDLAVNLAILLNQGMDGQTALGRLGLHDGTDGWEAA